MTTTPEDTSDEQTQQPSGQPRNKTPVKRKKKAKKPKAPPQPQFLELAYIAPYFLYLIGTALAGWAKTEVPWPLAYPIAYAAVVVGVGMATWRLMRGKGIVIPHWRIGLGVLVGLVGIVLWIFLSKLELEAQIASYLPEMIRPGTRPAVNPFEEIPFQGVAWAFIVVRLVGLALLVPVVEEVFCRGFLLRWTISENWSEVPLGQFSLTSFLVVTALFTLAHPEWLAAAVYCMLLNGLIYWKKDLWVCIVAHGVSNLALGIYILVTGDWVFW